jgi:hypothetical protein
MTLPLAIKHEWQPIETAPKDGAAVLVANGGKCQAVAFYQNSDWFTTVSFTLLDPSPSHWMPLPEPPVQS